MEREVAVEKGSDAVLSMVFCSNPPAVNTTWEWGSNQLASGFTLGRFIAERITKVRTFK